MQDWFDSNWWSLRFCFIFIISEWRIYSFYQCINWAKGNQIYFIFHISSKRMKRKMRKKNLDEFSTCETINSDDELVCYAFYMFSFSFISSRVFCRTSFIAIFMFCSLSHDFLYCVWVCLFIFHSMHVFVVVVAFFPFIEAYSRELHTPNGFERVIKSWVHSHQLTNVLTREKKMQKKKTKCF